MRNFDVLLFQYKYFKIKEMETLVVNTNLKQNYINEIADNLNVLLSDVQIHYMNLRSFHWNVKGNNFFLLHEKFEEFYNDAAAKADEIAERILSIGKKPFDSYQKYLATTEIEAVEGLEEGNLMVDIIIKDLNILLAKERLILEKASENTDEGTASLMSDFISEQEKLIWMLTAYRS